MADALHNLTTRRRGPVALVGIITFRVLSTSRNYCSPWCNASGKGAANMVQIRYPVPLQRAGQRLDGSRRAVRWDNSNGNDNKEQ